MKKKSGLIRKRASRGFTLVETLITVAVLGILTAAIALGVSGAGTTYKNITLSSEASVLMSTISSAITDELSGATDISPADGTYRSPVYGSGAALDTDENGCLVVTAGGSSYQLLNSKTYTSTLQADITVEYGHPCRVKVTLRDGQGTQVDEESFSVMPLN